MLTTLTVDFWYVKILDWLLLIFLYQQVIATPVMSDQVALWFDNV